MEQAVEQRGDGGGIAEQLSPVLDRSIRGEQRGNRLVVTVGGVVHDMRAHGTLEHGVNDTGEPSTGGRPISVAAAFENGVHKLRPEGMPITVERELRDGDLIWRYGPLRTMRLERVEP